jgi:glycosyl transferase family 25
VSAQFRALGLPFSFLEAVDGRKGLPEQLESQIDRAGTYARLGYGMSNGEYACALSHQLAYQRILDECWPGAIILEDDVILTHNFRRFYETRSYEAAPLIQLFYFEAEVWKMAQRSTPVARLHRLVHSAWMTVGYSITAEGAAELRAHSLPIRAHADWPCDTTLLGHFITEPRLVLHPNPEASTSTIAEAGRGPIPEDFDFSAGYAKGWRRLLSWASWKRLLTRPFRQRRSLGFAATAEEQASRLAA